MDNLEEDLAEEQAMQRAAEDDFEEELLKDFQEQLELISQDEAGREALEELEKRPSERIKEQDKGEQVDLKKTMTFTVPLKTKNATTVEVVIKEIVLHVERKLKYKVERIHTDPGSELQTKSLKAWCAQNNIRKTSSIPDKGNGSAESAVGLIKRQTRAVLSESNLAVSYWPFAAAYSAKQKKASSQRIPIDEVRMQRHREEKNQQQQKGLGI